LWKINKDNIMRGCVLRRAKNKEIVLKRLQLLYMCIYIYLLRITFNSCIKFSMFAMVPVSICIAVFFLPFAFYRKNIEDVDLCKFVCSVRVHFHLWFQALNSFHFHQKKNPIIISCCYYLTSCAKLCYPFQSNE
jgi:RsiW-degrading membrane proteinase PrsW (M82 family)